MKSNGSRATSQPFIIPGLVILQLSGPGNKQNVLVLFKFFEEANYFVWFLMKLFMSVSLAHEKTFFFKCYFQNNFLVSLSIFYFLVVPTWHPRHLRCQPRCRHPHETTGCHVCTDFSLICEVTCDNFIWSLCKRKIWGMWCVDFTFNPIILIRDEEHRQHHVIYGTLRQEHLMFLRCNWQNSMGVVSSIIN